MKKPVPAVKRRTKRLQKISAPALSRRTSKLKSVSAPSQPTRRTFRQPVRTPRTLRSLLTFGNRVCVLAAKRKTLSRLRKRKARPSSRQYLTYLTFAAPKDLVPTFYHRYSLSRFDRWHSPEFRMLTAFPAPVFVAPNTRYVLRNKKFLRGALLHRTLVSRSQTRRRIRAVIRWHGWGHFILGARRPYTRSYSRPVLRAPLQQAVFVRESLLRRRAFFNRRLRVRTRRAPRRVRRLRRRIY